MSSRALFRSVALSACLLGLGGACAGSAAAAVSPEQECAVGGADMAAAQQVAVAYWGATPCGGKVDVEWTDLASDTNAISSWTNPTSAYGNPSQNGDCLVRFNRLLAFDWPRFCTVLVHEFGHLDGHDHSPDPNDVMAAIYSGPISACGSSPVPAAGALTAPTAPTATTAAVAASNRAKPAAKRAWHRPLTRHRVAKRHAHRRHRVHRRHRTR
jgi:hypothetical protein